jgi:hypothetical protein
MGILGSNVQWGGIDFETSKLQDMVIRDPKGAGARFASFLQNGCQFEIKGPSVLTVDRSKPFNPEKFIGKGWKTLEEERALLISSIDFSKVTFENALREGEATITGEEKLVRLVSGGNIRLDAKTGQALFEEKGQGTLRFLYDTYGISWMEFAGTVLRNDDGGRYFLSLRRVHDGSWSWGYGWLGGDRDATSVSPLLAST